LSSHFDAIWNIVLNVKILIFDLIPKISIRTTESIYLHSQDILIEERSAHWKLLLLHLHLIRESLLSLQRLLMQSLLWELIILLEIPCVNIVDVRIICVIFRILL